MTAPEPAPSDPAPSDPAPSASAALDLAARRRFTVAAFRATRRYPGPAGTVLARELLAWADFGYRLGADRPLTALVDDLLASPRAAA